MLFPVHKHEPVEYYDNICTFRVLLREFRSTYRLDIQYPIFAQELCKQELNQTDKWIEIPEEVREMYKYYRSTPLVRAYGLEKALDTPAHIYFKNESVSPMGSHKLNSAIPQAYYCKKEGVTNVTTETGAGQWANGVIIDEAGLHKARCF